MYKFYPARLPEINSTAYFEQNLNADPTSEFFNGGIGRSAG